MKLDDTPAETRQTQATAVARATLTAAEVGPWLSGAYAVVAGPADRHAGLAGPAFAGYHEFGEGRLEVETGFPASGPVEGDGDVRPSELPGGQVAVTLHAGPYDQMEPAYQALASWVSEHGGGRRLSGLPQRPARTT